MASSSFSYERDRTPQTPLSRDSKSGADTDSNSSSLTYRRRSTSLRIPENYTHPSRVHMPGYTSSMDERNDRQSEIDHQSRNTTSGEEKSWGKRVAAYIPPVMNPYATIIQHWNQFFFITCLFSIFVDPWFFFILSVQKENKCIIHNRTLTTTLVVLRSITDFVYMLHILLQFRLAYVAPESRVGGAGELVNNPRKIARNYLRGFFWIDLFLALPVPQIIILLIPGSSSSSGANYAITLLRAAILVQFIPKVSRLLPFLAGQSPTGFIFEPAWADFVLIMLAFILAGHVIGSIWYLNALQSVNHCLHNACHTWGSDIPHCKDFMVCGDGTDYSKFVSDPTWGQWKNISGTVSCFTGDGFDYVRAVNLTTDNSLVTRYIVSLVWGFQQVGSLARKQFPSSTVQEVLCRMLIMGLGLLLYALLIMNIRIILQLLEHRSRRRRDIEQWMAHRRFPLDLREKVRQAERCNWAATRGVNGEMLMENLPEDLQNEIRRHLFSSS